MIEFVSNFKKNWKKFLRRNFWKKFWKKKVYGSGVYYQIGNSGNNWITNTKPGNPLANPLWKVLIDRWLPLASFDAYSTSVLVFMAESWWVFKEKKKFKNFFSKKIFFFQIFFKIFLKLETNSINLKTISWKWICGENFSCLAQWEPIKSPGKPRTMIGYPADMGNSAPRAQKGKICKKLFKFLNY